MCPYIKGLFVALHLFVARRLSLPIRFQLVIRCLVTEKHVMKDSLNLDRGKYGG